jgi:ClpP class serine protease
MKITHAHLAAMVFNRPLMIHRPKLHAIIRVLGQRIGASDFPLDDDEDDLDDDNNPMADAMDQGVCAIPVYGTLVKRAMGMNALSGLTGYEALQSRIMNAATNPDCKGILLDFDSYGGECAGAFDCSDLIYQAAQSVPVYGIANCNALSAGFALLSACTKLYVTQDGQVGSVGVIAEHRDESEYDSKAGFKYTTLTFGARKNDFSPHAPLSEDAYGELQDDINRYGNMFVDLVVRNRKIDAAAVLATKAGLLNPKEALAVGFVDQIGTREQAMADLQAKVNNRRLVPMPGPMTGPMQGQGFSVASASAAAISNKEGIQMSQPNPADATRPPDNSAATEAATQQARADYMAYVSDINALCELAGKSNLAMAFIQKHTAVGEVRKQLLADRAKPDGTELQTEAPVLPAAPGDSNRLSAAIQRRLNAQGLKPKVRSY